MKLYNRLNDRRGNKKDQYNDSNIKNYFFPASFLEIYRGHDIASFIIVSGLEKDKGGECNREDNLKDCK